MSKKVLIFGAGGFVGRYLTEELLTHDYQVFGTDTHAPAGEKKIPFFTADILAAEAVNQVFGMVQPDFVVNLAAISSVGQSWGIPDVTMEVNVVGPLHIMEAARHLEAVPKLMFIGSSEEYAPSDTAVSETSPLDANNPYGISKTTQERFAALYRERYGMKIACVRPFNHTGIGQRDNFVLPSFCKQAAEIDKTGRPGEMRVGNLSAKRDFSDVRDIVRAYRMILEADTDKIYNVGSGKAYALSELVDYIAGLSETSIDIKVDPDRFRPVDTPLVLCDHSSITQDLGWKPEHDIHEPLQEMFLHYRNL